jgi:hypothetical protein
MQAYLTLLFHWVIHYQLQVIAQSNVERSISVSVNSIIGIQMKK